MRFIVIDFESEFGEDYTLSKMTTEAYIRDPRFKAHGAAIKWSKDHAAKWYDEPQLRYVLSQEDWSDVFLISHHCLKGDVEVLTQDGWRTIENTPVGTPIMQWDSETNRLTWGETRFKTEGFTTEMLAWNTQFHRCAYTTEHRMAFSTPDNSIWRFLPANKISIKQPNNVYIPVSGIFESGSTIDLIPDEARLMEAIRADGSWKYKGDVCHGFKFVLKKTRKIERLLALLGKLVIKNTSQVRDDGATVINVNSCSIADRIFIVMGASKLYGLWVGNLSLVCREAILEEAEFWDGHRAQRRAINSYNLSSKHLEVVQAFQLMAHISGWSGQISSASNARGFTAHVPNAVLHKISLRKKSRVKLVVRPKLHKGLFRVFCFSVPTGAFLIRSEGRVCVTGNSHFDHLILSHHYSVVPGMSGCTLSMARLLLGNHISVSLDSVRAQFGMPAKRTPYHLFKGKRWNELDRATRTLLAEGCEDEVESIWKLFGILAKDFPKEEYAVVDQTIRMFAQPVLRADTELLAKIWEKEEHEKRTRLLDLGLDGAALRSADRFADLLRAQGIEPETKEGPPRKDGTRGTIFAFARTDPFMEELLEHEDPVVRALAEARLGEKSNILQTRAETLGFMASRGPLCVYLRYCGAATTRVAGGDGANWLNFKRGSDLRRAILAPEGYLLGPIDSSQIEFRCAMYLAGQQDLLEMMRQGADFYIKLASEIYNEQIYRPAKDDPRRLEMEQKRGCGKQGFLMCVYGAAAKRYQAVARAGLYGPPVQMTLEEAERHVQIARDMMPAVTARNTGYWAQCERIIARLAGGPPMEWEPFLVKDHRLILPNGLAMIYDTLEFHRPDADEECREFERDGYWRWRGRHGWKKIWGSKLTQNICEMVSRVIVSQAMIRIWQKYGIRTLNWPYDELLLLIPDNSKAEEMLELCRLEMCVEPSWLPGIPLDAEASLGARYSK